MGVGIIYSMIKEYLKSLFQIRFIPKYDRLDALWDCKKDKMYCAIYSLKTNDWKVNLKDCGEGKVLKGLKIQS